MSKEHVGPKAKIATFQSLIAYSDDGAEISSEAVARLSLHPSNGNQINPFRHFIELNQEFRSALCDDLAKMHPDAIEDTDDPQVRLRRSLTIRDFIRRELKKKNIEVNEDVFAMLYLDFIGCRDLFVKRQKVRPKE